jgi:hypothetical protein
MMDQTKAQALVFAYENLKSMPDISFELLNHDHLGSLSFDWLLLLSLQYKYSTLSQVASES